ncbi:MAG: DUF4292 domain-containing protein [Deltaproteobacteria bacterium]|nr:DUF4292 domain-containing protein [Deltaproteobacteria bacterium]MBW2395443.1 DUF4292 domain-containing protein [Deltaproteobacteria bacterium]
MSLVRALAVALVLIVGCRTAPVSVGETLDPGSAEVQAALATFLGQARAHQSLRGNARIALEGVRGASFARHLVVLERPARVRMEVMGLAGQRIAVLATDGQRFDLYRAETAKVESGLVHPGLLAEVGGVPLTPAELVALLLGAPPVQVGKLKSAVRGADGRLALTWTGPAGEQLTAILAAEGQLQKLRLGDVSGTERVVASYADHRPAEAGSFAHQVTLDFGSQGLRAEVNFRQVELDPELPEGLFRLQLVSSPGG